MHSRNTPLGTALVISILSQVAEIEKGSEVLNELKLRYRQSQTGILCDQIGEAGDAITNWGFFTKSYIPGFLRRIVQG
jgi:hypothetical protein